MTTSKKKAKTEAQELTQEDMEILSDLFGARWVEALDQEADDVSDDTEPSLDDVLFMQNLWEDEEDEEEGEATNDIESEVDFPVDESDSEDDEG